MMVSIIFFILVDFQQMYTKSIQFLYTANIGIKTCLPPATWHTGRLFFDGLILFAKFVQAYMQVGLTASLLCAMSGDLPTSAYHNGG